ncbi:HD domain-containing protein [Alkalibacillus silvisoli]|uniref:HD domain-containing protein n=1 Tax=Alkalibacillus silvisoli TaxID=392823 RepID=A0ABP3JFA8_9BACI
MDRDFIINITKQFVKEKLEREGTGHDWWHISRVVEMTRRIARIECADLFVCTMAALLHDLADEKVVMDEAKGLSEIQDWLSEQPVTEHEQQQILTIIQTISYKHGQQSLATKEAKVVQDADRLDAIGAIGIARCFAFAGSKGNLIHNPEEEAELNMTQERYRSKQGTAINHFYEKLLNLKSLMNTSEGYRIAQQRHQFMNQFLEQFYGEWEGKN